MTTTITSLIDCDAGGLGHDYSSLDAWEDDLGNSTSGNLVGDDERVVAQCANSGGGTDDGHITINSEWTTGSGNDINIEAYTGYRHAGKWDTSKYILETTTGDSGTGVIYLQQNYVYIDGLQISSNRTNYSIPGIRQGVTGVTVNNYISNCILRKESSGGSNVFGINNTYSNGSIWIYNCIIYDFTRGFSDSGASGTNAYFYNCIVTNCVRGFYIQSATGNLTAINCAVFDNADDFLNCGNATIDHCASDDGDGTNAQTLDASNNYENEFVDHANDDWRLVPGSVCIGNGTDDPGSGLYADDITGVARS